MCTYLLMFLLLAAPAEKPGSISGMVKDARLGPLIYAQVQVSRGNESVCEVLTDYEGKFVIRPLQPGDYTITVTWKGAKTLTREVKLPAGGAETVEFIFQRSDNDGSLPGTYGQHADGDMALVPWEGMHSGPASACSAIAIAEPVAAKDPDLLRQRQCSAAYCRTDAGAVQDVRGHDGL